MWGGAPTSTSVALVSVVLLLQTGHSVKSSPQTEAGNEQKAGSSPHTDPTWKVDRVGEHWRRSVWAQPEPSLRTQQPLRRSRARAEDRAEASSEE